ncbi:hypothetical protein ACFL5V_05760 [Fibrobacterota bacterium]
MTFMKYEEPKKVSLEYRKRLQLKYLKRKYGGQRQVENTFPKMYHPKTGLRLSEPYVISKKPAVVKLEGKRIY